MATTLSKHAIPCIARCSRRTFSTSQSLFNVAGKREKKSVKEARAKAGQSEGKLAIQEIKLDNHPLWNNPGDQSSLETFRPELLEIGNVGSVLAWGGKAASPFQAFGIPKAVEKDLSMTSRPFAVLRNATLELVDEIEDAKKAKEATRIVLTGGLGTGKSYLLMQGLSYCAMTDWVVFSVPKAVNLVNSGSAYFYDSRTRTYHQPLLAASLLKRLKKSNHKVLAETTLSTDLEIERLEKVSPKAGATLLETINFGLREPFVSQLVLERVLVELGSQTKYPFVISVDDVQALYCQSLYRTPQFMPIQAYHLALPRLLLEFASGLKTINRGMFLGAISLSDSKFAPPIELQESLDFIPLAGKPPSPYDKRSPHYRQYAKGLKAFRVPDKLSTKEATGIYEAWSADKALHTDTSDRAFLFKYCQTGGNPREFVWRGMMGTLVS